MACGYLIGLEVVVNSFALLIFCAVIGSLALACGPSESEPPDASVDVDAQPDSGQPELDAAESLDWGPPGRIVELSSSADEQFPCLSRSGLAITFTRGETQDGATVHVPHRALRPTPSDPFGPVARFDAFLGSSVWDLEMREDELEWFFWRGLGDLSFASRERIDLPFTQPQPLGVAGFSPSLAGNGGALYYLDLDGWLQLLRRQNPTSPWSAPISISIDRPFRFAAIDVSADELSMVIAAEPASFYAGLYISTRDTRFDSFGKPERIRTLEGPFSNPRLSADETELVFWAATSSGAELYRSKLVSEPHATPTARSFGGGAPKRW